MRLRWIAMVGVAGLLWASSPAAADMRTKSIRLVPDKDWKPSPQPIALSGEVLAADPHSADLKDSMDKWFTEAFQKLGYQIDADAPVKLHYTIDYVDWGSRVRRLVVGFNNSGIGGTIVVKERGKEIGRFRYSSKLRGGVGGGSTSAMGKEVAAPLALKLTNGERDQELHERKME